MTATISYDQPVTNLIDGLSATGHLGESGQPKHQTFRKTMVTMHHNGGVNLSHQSILNIWKTREASAHFDVDSAGAVAQYVAAGEYAWACASRTGNETSISIELANSTGSPGWQVSDTTWKSGARLAGWLFVHVIGARPTSSNLVYHHHWFATACAGPYMDKIYAQVLAETQRAYDMFRAGGGGGTSAPSPRPTSSGLVVDGYLGPATIKRWQQVMGTPADGVISRPSSLVRAVQQRLGVTADGYLGPITIRALQRHLGTTVDGVISTPSNAVKALQVRLNAGKF